jgi:hypothetical protein
LQPAPEFVKSNTVVKGDRPHHETTTHLQKPGVGIDVGQPIQRDALAIPKYDNRVAIFVDPRMTVGRNGVLKRWPNGWSTSAVNCCLLSYRFEAVEFPTISHDSSSASMLVIERVPFIQPSKASATVARLASVLIL